MEHLKRAVQCAYRVDDNTGNTYDSKGQVCGYLSKDDKMWIGIAAGLGTTVLLSLGIWVFIRRRRTRRAMQSETDDMRQVYAYSTPLLGWGNRPMVGRQSHMDEAPLYSPSLGGSPSPSSTSSHSEAFHFPILSADGHLLPPVPASASSLSLSLSPPEAKMGRLVSPVLSERPLPSPPMEETTSIAVPPPRLESRGSARPVSRQDYSGYAQVSLDSDRSATRGVTGLWPESQSQHVGGYGGYASGDNGDIGQISRSSRIYDGVRVTVTPPNVATPRLSPGLPYLQPQTATVHRSPSYDPPAGNGYRY